MPKDTKANATNPPADPPTRTGDEQPDTSGEALANDALSAALSTPATAAPPSLAILPPQFRSNSAAGLGASPHSPGPAILSPANRGPGAPFVPLSSAPAVPSEAPFDPAPPPGVYVQVWVARLPKASRERDLAAFASKAKRDGLHGIVVHGFPRGLPGEWPKLVRVVEEAGLLPLAAFGLDGTKDEDGTPLTAAEKGECVGAVAADARCRGVYLDAEGRWDQGKEPDALALGEALRKAAPRAWVGDQPWFAIDVHGELARTALPNDRGGVFRGFPVDEFAVKAVNGDRARQAYWANFTRQHGGDAYERVIARMERDWAKIRPAMQARGLARTEAVTIQGYGHDRLGDLVHCVLDWAFNRQTRVVVWCEPLPTPLAYAALVAAERLASLGFAGPGVDPEHAVRAAQASLGAHVDGVAGPETLRALGIRVGG